jgi:predicted SprT family Zn-dependent metalloprotease
MLEEIGTFNSLVDLLVLNEGYFHVPISVLKNLLEDYYEIWRVVQSQNIKRMTPQSFSTKDYDLDFSGTRFEFLNNLDPKPSIRVRYTKSGGSYFSIVSSRKLKTEPDYSKNKGFMQIDLSDPYRVVIDILEHEVLHYIQYYIQKYTRIKKGEIDPIFDRTKGSVGGLPPKKIIDNRYTTSGYSKDSNQTRRTKHSLRPIEYYPDLLSSIRQMEFDFSRYYPDYEYDENNPTKWEKEKKQFFVDVLKGNVKVSIASNTFKEFKTVSKQFYNHMVKVAYDAFVNKPPNLNINELKRVGNELGLGYRTSKKEISDIKRKEEIPYGFQQIKTNDNKMFEDSLGKDMRELYYADFFDWQMGNDPNEFSYNNILRIVKHLGLFYNIRNKNIQLTPSSVAISKKINITFPTTQDGVENIFKRLKEYKDIDKDIFNSWRGDVKVGRLKEEDRQKAYQSIYNYLVNMYLKKGKPNEYTKKEFLEFLEKLNF